MSIDHTFEVGKDEDSVLYLNISGLDDGGEPIDELSASFYSYNVQSGEPVFTCSLSLIELGRLHHHLSKYSAITETDVGEIGKFIAVQPKLEDVLSIISKVESTDLISALKSVVSSTLSDDDINTILGRKDTLEIFREMLDDSTAHSEADWQSFFESNEWIFGYGLKYRYLQIVQREAHISRTDLTGRNDVISDFLLSDTRFTKLVELKTPSTILFERRQNRSDSWRLSTAITDAVSQILAQKANWELESINPNYDGQGNRISEGASDVECILIIGSHTNVSGSEREVDIKWRTLELYRRNLRNIEIILYDELYERAKFIVEGFPEVSGG